MAILREVLMYMASYLMIIVGGFLLLNFMSNGFLIKFLLVKISRGKKKLIRCIDAADTYFTTGIVNSGYLRFQTREKTKKRINVVHGDFQRAIGIDEISVDMVTDNIVKPHGEYTPGLDAEKNENLIVRALTKPTIASKKDQAKFVLMMIIGICALGYIAFTISNMQEQIVVLTEMVKQLQSTGVVQ